MSQTEARRLTPWHTSPLPLGEVKASGWLASELRVFADGLAGHLYDFWPYVNDSKWLHPRGAGKGQDYSPLNEPLPYWFNGLVPLAYLLDDDRLKAQVHAVAETILAYQGEDGWLGPEEQGNRNFWGRTPLILGLMQLAEVDDKWCKPVVDGMRQYFSLMNRMLKNNGEGFIDGAEPKWGQLRVFDTIMGIQWVLENHPGDDDELWETMKLLDDMNPLKWENWYAAKDYPKELGEPLEERPDDSMPLHGVNVGQGLKASAVAYRFRPERKLYDEMAQAVRLAYEYHGAPSGTMLADEMQRNLAPWMGSELCMHVETAYSMAYAYHSLGINEYADKAELATYNAMPAAFYDKYWSHNYMTQPNQPWAKVNEEDYKEGKKLFTTAHSGVATTFGLEPQYPCCTSNLPQGWPKFITSAWGKVEGGLAHVLLGPTTVSTEINGNAVTVECATNYPFAHTLTYNVEAATPFDLYVRFPEWNVEHKSTLAVNGYSTALSADKSGLQRISLAKGSSQVVIELGAEVRVVQRAHGMSIYHGALLYALEIGSQVETVLPHHYDRPEGPGIDGFPASVRDHYLSNTSPWNVAIDPSTITFHSSHSVTSPAFEDGSAPTWISVKGREIQWPLYLNYTPDLPPKHPKCTGEVKEYRLIPYGGAKLHMSELPVISIK